MSDGRLTAEDIRRITSDLIVKQREMTARLQAVDRIVSTAVEGTKRAEEVIANATTLAERAEQQIIASKQVHTDTQRLVSEKTTGFPWLAHAIAKYHELCDFKIAEYLDTKLNPAPKAAELVRDHAIEKRRYRRRYIICRNRIEYYERLFPWLTDYVSLGIDDLVNQEPIERTEDDDDPVCGFMPKAEYDKLSACERNQLALNRYQTTGKKPMWQLGRDYERYIGYLYERDGYRVAYQGATEGLGDLGRDLIAIRGDEKLVIQCKRWAQQKVIREKHIFQLYGTTVEYWIKSGGEHISSRPLLFSDESLTGIRPVFVTSTSLSNEARTFAQRLGVVARENVPFDSDYPCIKCNKARRDDEPIYHLPFDQQYDNVVIEPERGEMYVRTTAEAEAAGFRRSWKWQPDPGD